MCLDPKVIKSKTRGAENYIGSLYYSDDRGNPYTVVPCGKCIECRNLYIEQWQIRWKEQIKDSVENSCYMLTLTYNDENLPTEVIDEETGEVISEVTTLRYSDVTKFLKRLRKRQDKFIKENGLEPVSIKYHYCGEYGTKSTRRPHYHMIITNVIIPIDGIGNFKNNTFNEIWRNGYVHIGTDVTEKSMRYILKYTLKNVYNQDEKETIQEIKEIARSYCGATRFDDVPEFHKFSEREIVDYWYDKLERERNIYFDLPFNRSDDKSFNNFCLDFLEQKKKEVKTIQEEFKVRNICRIYRTGKNKGRIIEKAICSKGIGKGYLTEKNIGYHKSNLDLGYMDYEDGRGWKERPLPRYYRDYIFNPILKIDEKKEYYRSIGIEPTKEVLKRQIRKYRECQEDYEDTLIYKKRVMMYRRNISEYLEILEKIDKVGEENYYFEVSSYKNVKSQQYMSNLAKYLAGVSYREPEFM